MKTWSGFARFLPPRHEVTCPSCGATIRARMADAEPELPEVIEMTEEETRWVNWEHATEGHETPGCDCGHNGMGPAWHTLNCPGAAYAYATFARRAALALGRIWP